MLQLSDLFENIEVQGKLHVVSIDEGHPFDKTATDDLGAFSDYDLWYVAYMWAEDDCLNIEITRER